MDLKKLFQKNQPEFRPDAQTSTWIKTMRMTRQQRLRISKWLLYAAAIVGALVVQDVIMSRVRIFGATTDLAVSVILLITVLEGTEVGSLFVLLASICYYFSGTAPGAYSIGLLCVFGIGAALLRQMYLHRSRGAITICAGLAQMGYELGLCAVGIFLELTRWDRLSIFAVAGLIGLLTMIPLYPLIHKIGLIGGNTWKE